MTMTGSNQLRDALDKARRFIDSSPLVSIVDDTGTIARGELCAEIDAALAAPPRNCDKVKTSWDVLKKWHEGLDTANDIVRMLDWLLAPATEKEGGNDGDK